MLSVVLTFLYLIVIYNKISDVRKMTFVWSHEEVRIIRVSFTA